MDVVAAPPPVHRMTGSDGLRASRPAGNGVSIHLDSLYFDPLAFNRRPSHPVLSAQPFGA